LLMAVIHRERILGKMWDKGYSLGPGLMVEIR
jgi:hypothetical protein